MKDEGTIPIIKKLKVFLHSKDKNYIKQIIENLEVFSINNEYLRKLKLILEVYPYVGNCTTINLETNIEKIKKLLEREEITDPIFIELFLTRTSNSATEISSHYEIASTLLKEKGFEKLSFQAFAWHLKWKSEEVKEIKEGASYHLKAAEFFKKSGENKLCHDALGLANVMLMSSTIDLAEQIKYLRKASYHFKKSGNIAVFQMKDFRRNNAIILYKFAQTKDSLLEGAKYYKEAANEFKIGGDDIFYHLSMALYYKCKLIGAKDWSDKAKIFSKIALHYKKGKKDKEYYKALGDKYNSLARNAASVEKTASNLKKAFLNYQKAGDELSSHLALGSYYQTKAIIAEPKEKIRELYLKAAEEFKKGKSLSDYHNALGYAKIFSISEPDKADPKLWKEIADYFEKGNTIKMQLLSMYNYCLSELRLTIDPKKQIIYKKNSIKFLKEYIDYVEVQQAAHIVDEFLISKAGIDSKSLFAVYKGIYYKSLADVENDFDKKKKYYGKAIDYFLLAIKKYPTDVALRNLGWIFFEIGNFSGSLETFKKARELFPEDESIRIETEIAEKALMKDYIKTKEDYEKEKEARKKLEVQSLKLIDILYKQNQKFLEESFMDRILRVLFDGGRNFEKSPKTFVKLHEPDLRNILLTHLNIEFKDEATGETIQGKGKTDIHIKNPDDHREIVIIECKKWGGEKQFIEGFHQKMGYLTGREKKSIMLIFSDRIHFSEVSHNAKKAIEKEKSYIENSIEELEFGSDIHQANFFSEHELGGYVKVKVYHLFFNLGFKSN